MKHTSLSMSMYGPVVTTDQDMLLSLTIDGCAFIHSATRPLAS